MKHLKTTEEHLLASILVDNKSIDRVNDYLKPYMITTGLYKAIYESMLQLRAEKFPINTGTLVSDIIKISDIIDITMKASDVMSGTHIQKYAEKIIKDKKEELLKKAENEEERQKIYSEYKTQSNEKIQFHNFYDLLIEAKEENENIDPEQCIGYGYNFLDKRLGGINKGELVLVGGITGTGKTTFSFKVGERVNEQGGKVVIVSMEERRVTKARKAIFYYCNQKRREKGIEQLSMPHYLNGSNKFTSEEQEEAVQHLANNIEFVGAEDHISINDLEEIYKQGADLYVLDHLHYFGIHAKDDSKANAVEQAMQKIKELTIKYDTRTILVAHFQKLDESKRPTMTNFKDSISIAQTADTIIMLWRDKSDSDDSTQQYETEFIVPKNRIDVPAFTVTSCFNHKINEYIDEAGFRYGTCNSQDYQKSYKQNTYISKL